MADIINNRFILFEKRAAFNTALQEGKISPDSIVFIKDQQKIWAQGSFFNKAALTQYKVGNVETAYVFADDESSLIHFMASGDLAVTGDANGNVTYSYTHPTWDTTGNVETGDGEFIKSITFDARGHIVSVEKEKIAQNSYEVFVGEANATAATAGNLADGAVHINIAQTDAITDVVTNEGSIKIQGLADDKISVTSAGNSISIAHKQAEALSITESTADLTADTVEVLDSLTNDKWGHLVSGTKVSVPTKEYVDNKLGAAVDAALILKGVVNSENDLPSASVVGHTYKVATAGEYKGEMCRPGDVIICVAVGENGANPEWAIIQSNVDVAGAALGLVKSGYASSVEDRKFGVNIESDGTMYVEVPYEDIPVESSKNVVAGAADVKENTAVSANLVYVNHIEDKDGVETITSSHSFAGEGDVKVSADENGNISIKSNDTNTTYAFSYSETASSTEIVITPTTTTNGVAAQGEATTISFNAWAYPDKQ